MTVGQALARAAELRPGCRVDVRTRQRWLCEEDGMLRTLFFARGGDDRAGVGADLAWTEENGLDESTELLAPPPFDGLYPHFLCASIDAALGENERSAAEQARCNSIAAELAAWLRRKETPPRRVQWRW